jgi:uncharacterized membrane protein
VLTVTLYSRENCHLCEQAEQDLAALQKKYPHELVVIDIESDPVLLKKFEFEIPVVQVGPYTLKAPFEKENLQMTLGAATDRQKRIAETDGTNYQKKLKRRREISKGDQFSLWFSKHYLLVFNLFVFLYVGLPVLAPVLLKVGAEKPAAAIYRVYGGLCHQLSYRSWFLFGEQPIYPRAAAGIDGYQTFQEATGLDESGLWPARHYHGSETTGYKTALCQRDIAIYGAILLFGIIFGLLGRRVKPLPLWAWLLIGMAPIGMDGVSQLISQFLSEPGLSFLQPYFGFLDYRESTPFLRTLTGFLFGWTTAWFGYPLVEETMNDARQLLVSKFARIEQTES